MVKVYLAHAISTKGEFDDSIRVASLLRGFGFEVYAAAENASINDKSNEPTVIDIYEGDISEILSSDIFVVNLSGGHQDGTISEVGFVAGLNEQRCDDSIGQNFIGHWYEGEKNPVIPIVAYTSNSRLAQPQFHKGVPSAHANHLVLGMIETWGAFVGDEAQMINSLLNRYPNIGEW